MAEIKERSYGIDALRCIATLFVLMLHTINRGGVFEASSGLNRMAILFVELISLSAVNCYALISGYVGYRPKKSGGDILDGLNCGSKSCFSTFCFISLK